MLQPPLLHQGVSAMGIWGKKSSEDHNSRFTADRCSELIRVAGKDVGDEQRGFLLLAAAGREIGARYLRDGCAVPLESVVNEAIRNLWKQAVVGAKGKVPPQFLRTKHDGSELNDYSEEIRHMVTARFGETQALVILAAAAGRQVADIFSRQSGAVRLENLLGSACESVREHAYIAAPKISPREVKELSDQQFDDLVGHIVNTATTNVTATDSLAATAKALGTLAASIVHFGRIKRDTSLEDVIAYTQKAVAKFAHDAMTQFKSQRSG
jgi:hypothetical protein